MRKEYKYLIRLSEYEHIKSEMLPYVILDKNASQRKNNEYTVRSLYYDTLQWRYYFEKIEGIKLRKKLRLRVYNNYYDNKIVYLEIKRKNENHISKIRSKLYLRDINKFFETHRVEDLVITSEYDGRSFEDAKMFLFHLNNENLKPTILVTYEREPYYYKFDRSLKITFDKNLRFILLNNNIDMFEEQNLQEALINKMIIEVKFSQNIPLWLRNLLTRYELQRMALSKYTICLDASKNINRINRYKKLSLLNSNVFQYTINN